MKWIAKYMWICPFHEMDSEAVHFMKWTISLSISRNGQFHTWVVTYTCLSLLKGSYITQNTLQVPEIYFYCLNHLITHQWLNLLIYILLTLLLVVLGGSIDPPSTTTIWLQERVFWRKLIWCIVRLNQRILLIWIWCHKKCTCVESLNLVKLNLMS